MGHGPYSDEYYACGRSSIGRVWWDETKDSPDLELDEETYQALINRSVIHEDDSL